MNVLFGKTPWPQCAKTWEAPAAARAAQTLHPLEALTQQQLLTELATATSAAIHISAGAVLQTWILKRKKEEDIPEQVSP